MKLHTGLSAVAFALICTTEARTLAQQPAQPPSKTAQAPVERLGPNLLRVGKVQIDTAKKEVSVRGSITAAVTLEFIAVAKGGFKAYESAIELDATAIDFNLGLILAGLDPAHGTVPKMHFDPNAPKGDPVEIWVEWDESSGGRKRIRAEQLVYNEITKQTLSEGPWVYTGSAFSAENNAYLADLEGTLIGFVHTPAPVIESPRPLLQGAYGNNILNPTLNLKAGIPVVLTVRALPVGK
jgi:hypothetical protein